MLFLNYVQKDILRKSKKKCRDMDIRFELQALPNRNSEVFQNSQNEKKQTNK